MIYSITLREVRVEGDQKGEEVTGEGQPDPLPCTQRLVSAREETISSEKFHIFPILLFSLTSIFIKPIE